MDERLRRDVRRRAGDRCEYCLIPQAAIPYFTFHVDHVLAKQHVGESTDLSKLAFACHLCNAHKGPNLASIDPETDQIVLLYNPREHAWSDHFALEHGLIVGLTSVGRATARLLNMNAPHRVELRREWLNEEGDFF